MYIYGKLYIIIHGEINEHISNKRGMNIKESKKGYMLFKLKKVREIYIIMFQCKEFFKEEFL